MTSARELQLLAEQRGLPLSGPGGSPAERPKPGSRRVRSRDQTTRLDTRGLDARGWGDITVVYLLAQAFPSLCLSISVSLSVSVCLSVSHYLSVSVCVCLSVCLCVCLCLSLSVSVSLSTPIKLHPVFPTACESAPPPPPRTPPSQPHDCFCFLFRY